MEYLQLRLIGSVLAEGQYNRVRFLEPGDFTNFKGKPFRKLWQLIQKIDSTQTTMLKCVMETEDKELLSLMAIGGDLSAYYCLEQYALKLLEYRFKALFGKLLLDMTSKSNDAAEIKVMDDYLVALMVRKDDIFLLTDSFLDFIGPWASKESISRVKRFLTYRNDRIASAKKIINAKS